MKKLLRFLKISVLVYGLLSPVGLSAGNPVLKSESKLWLLGDSSMHAYSSTATRFDPTFEFEPGPAGQSLYETIKRGGMKKLDVDIPVKDMKSGKNKLDRNMQKSLKAAEHPLIQFHLVNYQVAPSTAAVPGLLIKASGQLKVAGVEKTVDIEATATKDQDGVRIQGAKELLMSEFGVKPPSILMIKTRDRVIVHFDLIVGH